MVGAGGGAMKIPFARRATEFINTHVVLYEN